jgi:hypothetical protein
MVSCKPDWPKNLSTVNFADGDLRRQLQRHHHKVSLAHATAKGPQLRGEISSRRWLGLGISCCGRFLNLLTGKCFGQVRDFFEPSPCRVAIQRPLLGLA